MAAYNTEDIERGLWALALHAGRIKPASDFCGIPHNTLHDWKTKQHAERYTVIQQEASGKIAERIAAQAEAFMLQASETEALALEKLHEAIANGELESRDLPNALRNITTSKALNNDKVVSPLRGRPTIVEHRHTGDDALQRLARLGIIDLPSSAVQDVTDETQALNPGAADTSAQ